MKAYRDLSLELGRNKLQQQSPPGGTEPSHAGKMRIRRRSVGAPKRSWVDTAVGRDHLISRKLRNAVSDGSYEEVLELIRKGADVTAADSKGRTALHFASCKGDAHLIKLLISYGASVNQKDCNGNTPLHLASCTHHVGVVTALLKAGTDVNAMDLRGVTPLHLALSRLRILGEGESSDTACKDFKRKEITQNAEGSSGSVTSEDFRRKKDITQIVEMIGEYLHVTDGSKDETEELEKLASQLSLSETPQQVDMVQSLLESFTTLSIQRRQDT